MIGTTLGPYEITAKLGEGGMGEVLLIEGQSLAALIPDGGLPIDRILSAAAALADALAAAHEKGIVHRDLKPANVMMTTDGRLKVLDFGLAKEMRGSEVADATHTAEQTEVGVIMGTPAYMSPEQVAGKSVDHRTESPDRTRWVEARKAPGLTFHE